ncbi:butyrate kinase [Deinococcus sp. Marseille-Q6407]|uniref:butyrate kinase n=1 Tax=Deinococcus sp. Marseille-Q6407 TaxID=2969223 RepID=UPI0021BF2395|nr:butyrate kinase [Deinococcus sp. Marseille-Q6407]
MRVYVLSVSSSRLKVGLADLTLPASEGGPGAPEALGPDGRLTLNLTRADLPVGDDLLNGTGLNLESTLAYLDRETADWPRPDAVATLAQWEDSFMLGHWAARPQVIRTEPEQLPLAQQNLPTGAVLGTRGLQLAIAWAQALGVPLLTVPLPQSAELPPEARETGIPGLRREPRFHVLNSEMAAREGAFNVGKRFSEAAVVAAHLGSTSSVTAYQGGRVVNTTGSGLFGGPLGLRQAGMLAPATLQRLWEEAEQGQQTAHPWTEFWTGGGGLRALTGCGTVHELMTSEDSSPQVQAAAAAFVHQVACAVGQQVGALTVRPDAIVLAGPLARWDSVMDRLEARLSWMAPVFVIPGDPEFEAVARAAGRALMGWAPVSAWPPVAEDLVPEEAAGQTQAVQPAQAAQTAQPAAEQPAPSALH